MRPAEAIDMLDRQLAEHGETVTLRRMAAGVVAQSVDVSAFVRGFEPRELVNGITQKHSKVIMSPTGLAGWPSAEPAAGQDIVIAGRARMVMAAHAIRFGSTVVRIECAVA